MYIYIYIYIHAIFVCTYMYIVSIYRYMCMRVCFLAVELPWGSEAPDPLAEEALAIRGGDVVFFQQLAGRYLQLLAGQHNDEAEPKR